MNRLKWHPRLVHIGIALTLVVSLLAMGLPTVVAQDNNGPDLAVHVEAEPDELCPCGNFTVTATITNNLVEGELVDVWASINWTPFEGARRVLGGNETAPHPIYVGNITAGSSEDTEWVLHCEQAGDVVITVDAWEAGNGGLQASGNTTVTQWGVAQLRADISAPEEGDILRVCEDFPLTFTITNIGDAPARTVNARIDPSAHVNGVGYPAGQSFNTATIPYLDVGDSHNWTVMMHCDGLDAEGYVSSIHVMPAGKDHCTDREIEARYVFSDIVEFYQRYGLTCEAQPNPTKVCHNVTFNATIGVGAVYPVSWNWTFDDGHWAAGVTSNSTITTTHHYGEAGNYTAVITTTDNSGNGGSVASCNVTVEVFPPLAANCTATPNPTKVCHNVTFTGYGVDGLPYPDVCGSYNWTWHFGDGTEPVSGHGYTSGGVTHHYAQAGNYTATFKIWDNCMDNEASCNVTVEVFPPLEATCSADPNPTKVGHEVVFNGTGVGGLPYPNVCDSYDWNWDFGDGNFTNGSGYASGSVAHNYTTAGNYTAVFTIWDDCLDNEASCNVTVQVFPALEVNCYVEPEIAAVCDEVQFSAERVGGVDGNDYTWHWDFGDGHTSDVPNPTHVYVCPGNWTAVVTLTDTDLKNIATCNKTVEVSLDSELLELEPISPINMAQLTSKTVTFEWVDIGCANYTLEVCQKDGREMVVQQNTGWINQWTGCIFDGNWQWRVTAVVCNQTITSDWWYFQMDAPEPSVTVLGPNGGETLACGSTRPITWTAMPMYATIDILLSADGGATWTEVASGEANDGAYPWQVPCINSDQCLVRLIARDGCQGEGADTSDGVFTITAEPAPVTSYNITLAAGWNLISLPLIPENTSTANVTASISTDLSILWHYDASTATWSWYSPGNLSSTLSTMEDGKGYWADMNAAGTLEIEGQELPDPPALPPTYSVVPGWNLIGFKSTISLHHSAYLFNLWSGGLPNYSVIWGYDASVPKYVNVFPLGSHGGNLEPGHGYWLWATAAGEIVPIS